MKSDNLLRQELFQFEFGHTYHFDNFFVSEGNEAAWLAAKKVCRDGFDFGENLFFYGEPGCGKSHLLQAIGNELALENLNSSIKLLPCKRIRERFVGVLNGERELFELIRRYESSNALLIDDIEEISFSTLIQEALFHLYNHFREEQKPIVATGRNFPSTITGISSHLTTRLGWGMAVGIGSPDERTRKQVLERLASEKKLSLSEKEYDYILNHFPRDYPTLRLTIETINSYSLLTRRKVTIPLIKEACRRR